MISIKDIKENIQQADIFNMSNRLNVKARGMLGNDSQDFLKDFGQKPQTLDIFHEFLDYVSQELLNVMAIKTSFKPKELKRDLYMASLPINVKKRFLNGQVIPLNPFSTDKEYITKHQFELIKHASRDLFWSLLQDAEFKDENLATYQDGFHNKFFYCFKVNKESGEPVAFSVRGNLGMMPTKLNPEGSGVTRSLAQVLKKGFKLMDIGGLN